MVTLHGKGVSRGVAIGRACVLRRGHRAMNLETTANPSEEWQRYEMARNQTVAELQDLCERTGQSIGAEQANIFAVHAMMAQDEDFCEAVKEKIELGHYAEYAVSQAARQFSAAFAEMEDEYMRERAIDVADIADRMLRHLLGESEKQASLNLGEEEIICAQDLSPSETVQLDRDRVCAFVTAAGSSNSHTAILSRTMDIPAVIGLGKGLDQIVDGDVIAVDADKGVVYLRPSEQVLRDLRMRVQENIREKQLLEQYRDRESRTRDGHRMEICANVGNIQEAQAAMQRGADGIGLFRSEFLYMGRGDLPTEEEQFWVYRSLLESMPDRRVVVRTLDIGADKEVPYFHLPREENPVLGMRGCRVSLSRPEIFLTQCRALLRASHYGRLAVMFPLITSCSEVDRLRDLWERAREELQQRGVAMADKVEIGVMIETPAAALICDRLAPMVDFFSIGSNDLTQYTLAIDRQNEALDAFYDSHHEAVLRLIRNTVQAAHQAGIWVGICGELGADLSLTEHFLRMGVDEVSVTPGAVLRVRKTVCELQLGSTEREESALFAKGGTKWD